jgi:sugar (pentulose or hexulose) kinase
MELNTLIQLHSIRVQGDPQLDAAHRLLMIPNLFHYWLSGEQVAEYTIASTSQMLLAHERRWDTQLLERLQLPTALLPIVQPGTVLGPLLAQVAEEDPASPRRPRRGQRHPRHRQRGRRNSSHRRPQRLPQQRNLET